MTRSLEPEFRDPQDDSGSVSHSVAVWFRKHVPESVRDTINFDSTLGLALGVGAGVWAAAVRAIENTETVALYALAGAAVGVLAIVLAVMALLMGMLPKETRELIGKKGVKGYFRPFKIVALVSGAAILTSVAGAIDASGIPTNSGGEGPSWFPAALFGVAIGLFVWAVVGTVQLLRIFMEYGVLDIDNEGE